MNKEQLIEEMAKLLFNEAINYCNANGEIIPEKLAKTFYKEGYRKVPDGAVILTPEERDEEIKAFNEKQAELEAEIKRLKKQNDIAHFFLGNALSHIDADKQMNLYMQASKEGAQEFAKKLKSKLQDFGDGGEKSAYLTENDIDNLLKEFLG